MDVMRRHTINVRWEVSPMTARVANAETVRVCQRNGEIDALECLPGLDTVQVVDPGRRL